MKHFTSLLGLVMPILLTVAFGVLVFISSQSKRIGVRYFEKTDERNFDQKGTKTSTLFSSFLDFSALAMFRREIYSQLFKSKTLNVKQLNCLFCKGAISLVQHLMNENKTRQEISDIATKVCIDLHIEDERVCIGAVGIFKDEVLTVLDQLALNPNEICGLLIGSDCAVPYNPADDWNVTLPNNPKPPVVPPVLPKPGSPTLRVLHLTDIHLDLMYSQGANAICNEPLCCRANDGLPELGQSGAGLYGDYRACDTPLWTLQNLFSHLSQKQHEFDYIMWTGDLPAHNIWEQTRANQFSLLQKLTAMLLNYFPNKPVFPALGNHESTPVNSFPPAFVTGDQSASWLYDALVDAWKPWLNSDALRTVKYGAYYTISPYPGFRIISINTNYCNNENWWLLLNTTDPNGQLSWLVSTLQAAENSKEKVHILGHIPPGTSDCLKVWSHNYYRIVDRYESTITGQYFGHTHFDHFEMFYDIATLKRPTGVAYISPSVTPFSGLNLGYRIFNIDGNYNGSSWAVLDHDTFILNLTNANLHPLDTPVWQHEYNAKLIYGLESLFPSDWDKVISQLTTNDTLFDIFYRYYQKSHVEKPCDQECRTALICGLRSGRSHSPELCSSFKVKSYQNHLKHMAENNVC